MITSDAPPATAAQLHRSQGRALVVLGAVGGAFLLPLAFLRLEALLLPALIGAAILVGVAWGGRGWLRRTRPPMFTVVADPDGIEARWAGARPVRVPWSDVKSVVPNATGHALISRGGRTIVLPGELSHRDALMSFIEQARATAPAPTTETRFDPGMNDVNVPVSDGDSDRIQRARRISKPAGASVYGWAALFGLGMWAERVELAIGALGLGFLAAGVYLAIEFGYVGRILGVSVQRSLLVVQTVRRGRMAAFTNIAWGLIGVMLAVIGLLVVVASIAGALEGLP